MLTNYTQMSDTLGPRKISPFGATESLPNLRVKQKSGNPLRTRSNSKRKSSSLKKTTPVNLQTKYPKKGYEQHPNNLTECWKKMDKMQAKIEKFDKKLSKQETSFGTEENYRELLVKYNITKLFLLK